MDWPSRETLYAIIAVVAVCLTGLVRIIRAQISLRDEYNVAVDFRARFVEYYNTSCQNQTEYYWLIGHSSQIQEAMGEHGILHSFRPPYANYVFREYPIVLNMLPEVRRLASDNQFGFSDNLIQQYAQTLDEALVRHIGSFERLQNQLTKDRRNPVVWFREGMRFWVGSPIILLGWLGVLSAQTVRRSTSGFAFRLLAASVSVIAFISTVFTITLGWRDMEKLLLTWLTR
jgi:hypothetical protein